VVSNGLLIVLVIMCFNSNERYSVAVVCQCKISLTVGNSCLYWRNDYSSIIIYIRVDITAMITIHVVVVSRDPTINARLLQYVHVYRRCVPEVQRSLSVGSDTSVCPYRISRVVLSCTDSRIYHAIDLIFYWRYKIKKKKKSIFVGCCKPYCFAFKV
jgi:hypothetical protein